MQSATDPASVMVERAVVPPSSPDPVPADQSATAAEARVDGRRRVHHVLIIDGHPRPGSLCAALARAYGTGARDAGMEVRALRLADLAFDPHVRTSPFAAQPVEPAIAEARELIRWSDHLVLVYPLWWGTMPALLKGFLDRVLAPGQAFVERPDGQGYRGLLEGRSAQLLVTMDTPPWAYRLVLGQPGVRAMRRDVLGFCGIAPVRSALFGPVIHSTARQRERWLAAAHANGAALTHCDPMPLRLSVGASAWLRALRLQFYPMTWAAYSLGALAAAPQGTDRWAYWLGYLGVFALEAATVLTNELIDRRGDALNQHYGPFNGGSRMLVEGRMQPQHARTAIAVALVVSAIAFGCALGRSGLSPGSAAFLLIGAVVCIGYTAPPLRLSYRGLGEVTVAVTHGALVILLGWTLQGGALGAALPWLLALPLGVAILPSIILANVPDRRADREVGKRTLAVILGNWRASTLAGWCAVAAAIVAAGVATLPASRGLLDGVAPCALVHAAFLLWLIERYHRRHAPDGRIDGLIIAALVFMLWFILLPLLRVLSAGP